jgi:hypothetical protein
MNRFSEILRRTAQKLDLPQPVRSRVLLELAGDLEALYDLYVRRGLDDSEAARRVEEKFAVSDDVLVQLTRLHRSALRRWLDRLSEQAQTRWERSILAAVILFVVVVTGPRLVTTTFIRDASGWIWVVTAIALAALALAMAKIYQLFIKGDHRPAHLRNGLPALLFLGCASSFTGLFGLVAGLYRDLARMAASPDPVPVPMLNWLLGSVATMTASLMVSVLCAVSWFFLMSKVKRIEQAEAALLLEARS